MFEGEPLAASVYAGVSELDLKYFVYQYLDITVEDRVKLGGAEREGPASCLNCSLSVSRIAGFFRPHGLEDDDQKQDATDNGNQTAQPH